MMPLLTKSKKTVCLFLCTLFLCTLLPLGVFAEVAPLAVFPLLDLSRGSNGINLPVTSSLIDRLSETGTEVVPMDTIISFMHNNRIRAAGQLDTFHMQKTQDQLGSAYVLYGSILQNQEVPNPTLGLALYLVRTYDYKIVWSYVSTLSKADLRKPLEIGEAQSTLELQPLLEQAIIDHWPAEIVNQEKQAAISIDSFTLSPRQVRPGEEVHCRAYIRSLVRSDQVPEVFFKTDNQIYPGSLSQSGDSYEATWIASEKDGSFTVFLIVEWPLYGRSETFAIGSYVVDGQPPLIEVELKGDVYLGERPVFRNKVVVVPNMIVRKPLSRWRIAFKNKDDVVVAVQEEKGNLPERFTWRAQNLAASYETEGRYRALLEVWDLAGNSASASEEFELYNVPPEVAMLAQKDGSEALIELKHQGKIPLSFYRLEIWSEEGRLIKKITGDELPSKVDLQLEGSEVDRKLESILVTQDILGNNARQRNENLFPTIDKDAAEAEKEKEKTKTKSWVDEF